MSTTININESNAEYNKDGILILPTFPKNQGPISLNITLSNIESLPDLSELSEDLEELNLTGCSGLKSLPKLPKGLEKLDLYGCDKLIASEDLLKMLQDAEDRRVDVRYPKHFNLFSQSEAAKELTLEDLGKPRTRHHHQ